MHLSMTFSIASPYVGYDRGAAVPRSKQSVSCWPGAEMHGCARIFHLHRAGEGYAAEARGGSTLSTGRSTRRGR